MGIFSMEDPLTPEYIEHCGFHTIHDKNNPTILYRMRVFRLKYESIDDAELRFYFRASKKSKVEFCELSYRVAVDRYKSMMIRHKMTYPKTQQDLDMLIFEARTIFAKARGVNVDRVQVSKKL